MKTIIDRRIGCALLLSLLLAGCGGAAQSPAEAPFRQQSAAATAAPIPASGAAPADADVVGGAAEPAPEQAEKPVGGNPALPLMAVTDPSRKIIKDATFLIEVESVPLAMSQVGATAAQAGGYVLETRTDGANVEQQGALVKVAVPVERFEESLQRIRETAAKVVSEQASGQDVSQEFVDAQSQLANLEATQARIREFLEQAETVEESLKVNAELSAIEGQISELKGRLQFLGQRAAFSTITVQLRQSPEPTFALPALPRMFAGGDDFWDPAATADNALEALTAIGKGLATILIWVAIVGLPLALPFLAVWLVRRRLQGRPPAAQ